MPRVVSFGSVNIDRVAYVDQSTVDGLAATYDWFPAPGETVRVPDGIPPDFDRHVSETFLGGKGANQAVAAAAADADAALVGTIGEDHDDFGVLAELSGRGVDTEAVAVVEEEMGTAFVFVTPDGENHIAYYPGANRAATPEHATRHLDGILAANCLLVQNELPTATTEHLLTSLRDVPDRPTVVVDPAPSTGAARLLDTGIADVVTPNKHEATLLTDALDGPETVIETRGEDTVVVTDGRRWEVSPPSVTPVDTTGAGDVFAGYLAARLAAGDDRDRAIRAATTAAALSTEHEGVQRAVPDRSTVTARLHR